MKTSAQIFAAALIFTSNAWAAPVTLACSGLTISSSGQSRSGTEISEAELTFDDAKAGGSFTKNDGSGTYQLTSAVNAIGDKVFTSVVKGQGMTVALNIEIVHTSEVDEKMNDIQYADFKLTFAQKKNGSGEQHGVLKCTPKTN